MSKFAASSTCRCLYMTLLLTAGPVACSREPSDDQKPIESANSQSTSKPMSTVEAAYVDSRNKSVVGDDDLRVSLRDGRLRVFFIAGNDQATLIRIRNDSRQALSEKEQAEIRASESEMVQRWLTSKSRFSTKPPSTPLEEHDALLEVAYRLEPLHQEDPEHLGILRDLLTVYAQLLAFEQESDLGSNLCVLAGDKLLEFERRAAPLDSNDQQRAEGIRAWLHYAMHHYPTAAFSGDTATRNALRVLDQQYFETQPSFQIGRLRAEVYTTLGKSPDPDLLWDAVHFLVGNPGDKNPAHTVAYTLCAQGPAESQRWYLMGHALNRASLIRLFGTQRPEFKEVQSLVIQHVYSQQPRAAQAKKGDEE